MKTNFSKAIGSILILLLLSQGAWALDLQSAKDQGLVGEANTGLLAPVGSNPGKDVRDLVASVNQKRNAQFKKTAQSTGASLDQVRARFYELAVQRTKPGHYYQNSSGKWVKK